MAGVPPKKNTAYTTYVGLEDKANPGLFKASPTLAAGDWKIAIDDGAPANLATLPVVDADFTKRVKVALSADEMNGDHITIIASDAAGAEWYDLQINIDTDAKQIGDLATQTSVDDVPTVAEFNARTLPSTTYFDPATDTVTPAGGQINSVSGTVTLADDGITADKLAASAIAEIAAAATGLTAQQMRDAMKLAPTAGTPADGSVDDHLDDLATALAAATTSLTVVSAVDGGELAIYQAVSFQATISGLAIPADWTKVYWTVKRATSEADTDAILQLVETNPAAGTDGLLRLNGAAGTAANGTLTVNQAAGTVVIDLVMTICDDLALATGLVWSLKALRPTSASTLLAIGTVNVLGQATAAVA